RGDDMGTICAQMWTAARGWQTTVCMNDNTPEGRSALLAEARERFPGAPLRIIKGGDLGVNNAVVLKGACCNGCGCFSATCKGRSDPTKPGRPGQPVYAEELETDDDLDDEDSEHWEDKPSEGPTAAAKRKPKGKPPQPLPPVDTGGSSGAGQHLNHDDFV